MSDALPSDVVASVEAYYQRDDISHMCPGRNDCITVRDANGRERKQKRYNVKNLKEAHQLFLHDTNIAIEFTKFCEVRPFVTKRYACAGTMRPRGVHVPVP